MGLFDVAGAGIGILGDFLGGRSAARKQRGMHQRAMRDFLSARQAQETQFGMARNRMYQGLGALQGGYGQAQAALSSVGAEAFRQNRDLTRMAVGQADARSAGRGLYNSTIGQGLRAQAAYQGQRRTADISQRLAQLRSGLYAQQGQAMAGQQNIIGQSHMAQGQAGMQASQAYGNLLGSAPAFHDSGPWNQLGAFGSVLGQYWGDLQQRRANQRGADQAVQRAWDWSTGPQPRIPFGS